MVNLGHRDKEQEVEEMAKELKERLGEELKGLERLVLPKVFWSFRSGERMLELRREMEVREIEVVYEEW